MSKPTPLLSRASVAFGLLALAMAAAVVVGMIVGGGATPTQLADAGDIVRWGLPLAKGVTNLGTAIAIGSLAFAAYALAWMPFPGRSLLLAVIVGLLVVPLVPVGSRTLPAAPRVSSGPPMATPTA